MIVLLHAMLVRSGSCIPLVSERAGVLCEMAVPTTVQFSTQHVSQKNHREMVEAYQVFCSIYMLLQSDSPPSASFD